MKIAIIVAMRKELDLLLPLFAEPSESSVEGYRIYSGKIAGHDVSLMQCGIGKVNSALSTAALIDFFKPDIVINSGVAGGADLSMHVCDLLVATEVCYHDVWCGPDTEYGAAYGLDVMLKPDSRVVEAAHEVLHTDNVRYGLICSGDKFITTAEEIAEIKRHFPAALAVDMESASIAQACTMRNVPFAVIRVISDTPGSGENISQYENFWTDAPRETFKALTSILSRL